MSKETGVPNLTISKTIRGDDIVKRLKFHRTIPKDVQDYFATGSYSEVFDENSTVDTVAPYVDFRNAEIDQKIAEARADDASDRLQAASQKLDAMPEPVKLK